MGDAAPTPRELAEATYHRACQRWGRAPRGVTFREAFVAEIEAAIREAMASRPATGAATR
jgi:hypothetical protein